MQTKIPEKTVPPTEIELRLIGRAFKRGDFDHPVWNSWDKAFTVEFLKGIPITIFWYNDSVNSTHFVTFPSINDLKGVFNGN